jgi:calpain-7
MSQPERSLEDLRSDAEQLRKQLLHSSSKDEALEVAIKAAETSMRALKLAQDPVEKSQLSARLKHLLGEAEQIKRSTDWRKAIGSGAPNFHAATPLPSRLLKEPQSTRQLPNHEQILLLKAGFLNGFKFPPWTGPPASSEFELQDGEELFMYVSFVSFLLSQLTAPYHQRWCGSTAV